uniref:HTH araC/xylS-type domain-containing protein n=1 Tax=Heterorhabditis bacteriophora TaxID=37862 RepID=A0A1I7XBL7_HETBA
METNGRNQHSDTIIYSTLFKKKFAKVFGLESKANKCIQTCLEAESPKVGFSPTLSFGVYETKNLQR